MGLTRYDRKESRTHNTGLAKVAAQCSADTFVVNQIFVLRINICGENRHLRQARTRFVQLGSFTFKSTVKNMEDLLDHNDESLHLTDKDIFIKIWTSPRQVFKYINDNHYDKYVTVLLVLSGISRAFDRASMKNMGDKMSILAILAICIIAGGLFGWVSYYLYAALVSWTGKWLKGQGNTTSILRVFSFAMIPSIVALVFLIPQIGIYGVDIFKEDGDITSASLASNIFVYGSMLIEVILGICTLVFCVIGLSEVQKLSIGKSILNLLLPALIIVASMFIIVLLLKTF